MKKQQDKCKRLRDDLIPRWVHNDIRASGAIGNAQSSSRGWVPPPETSKNRDVFEAYRDILVASLWRRYPTPDAALWRQSWATTILKPITSPFAPVGIRWMLGVPPETRCEYILVRSSKTSMFLEVSGGTPNTQRIVRDWRFVAPIGAKKRA